MKIKYTELIKYWESLGICDRDIAHLLDIRSAYARDCEEISFLLSLEGKPSYGDDYELRCGAIRSYYTEEEKEIFARYGL